MLHLNEQFERLIEHVQGCNACPSMDGCTRVLSWANGSPGAEVMFVGEAPGRLGADRTSVPFHGDAAGDNFERLLKLSGLTRRQVFVTNAVLCNPRDSQGNNAPPPRGVLIKCAENLRKQIEVVQPLLVVTLGSAALESTRIIEDHGLSLRSDVRTSHRWNNVDLVPLYHPGARAMIHRNFTLQSADYYFVGELLRRKSKKKSPPRSRPSKSDASWDVVRYVISKSSSLSLFRLHKFLYLLDCKAKATRGRTITQFLYIRQKDGPYCVELGSRWFKDYQDEIKFTYKEKIPYLHWNDLGLFATKPDISNDDIYEIDSLIGEVVGLSDSQLKTRAYLTEPMRKALRAEREGTSRLNAPLL